MVPLAALWIPARLGLVSTADDEQLSPATFNGVAFFTGKACVNPLVLVVAPGLTNTSVFFFFLMSRENYMEIRRVNGIFASKVSQILI